MSSAPSPTRRRTHPLEHVCVTVWNDTGERQQPHRQRRPVRHRLAPCRGPIEHRSSIAPTSPTHGGTTSLRCGRDQRTRRPSSTSSSAMRRPARSPAISRLSSGRRSRAPASRCSAGLSGEPRFAGPTGPDGAYEVDDLGTGSYFVGFFGCNERKPGGADARPRAPGDDLPRAVVLERVARPATRSLWRRGDAGRRSCPTRRPSSTSASTSCNNTIWITGAPRPATTRSRSTSARRFRARPSLRDSSARPRRIRPRRRHCRNTSRPARRQTAG